MCLFLFKCFRDDPALVDTALVNAASVISMDIYDTYDKTTHCDDLSK